ncbi:hypothetical protein FG379_001406 [Cryptosporidium bovis]|uniref:uncharacterized protein n=1 Tax=Cryptosporidium bovis TaxID=310047 RepID=UPI00351A7EB5|nr:hypothetical protein FG379_001406 [Cryptosporidium bovis]
MSLYYRFLHERSESYRSIELNVSSIRTSDLKLLVAEHSGLSKEYMKLFDLKVLDTDEKEIFPDDKLLPVYSRVVIQRIPWRELKEIHHDAQKSINNEVVETVAEKKLTLPSEYICKLCNYPLINPVLIKCIGSCGASACRDCVKNYLEQNKSVAIKSCPSCGQRFRGSVPNKSLANMLAAIDWDKFDYPVRNPKMESSNAGNNRVVEEGLPSGDLGFSGNNNLDNNIGKEELFENSNIELNNSNIPDSNLRNVYNVKNEEFDSLENNSNSSQNINNSVSLKSVYSSGIVSNTSEELSTAKSSSNTPSVSMVNNNEIAQESALVREGGTDLTSKSSVAEVLETINFSNSGTKESIIQNQSNILVSQQQVSRNTNSHNHSSATFNSSLVPLLSANNNTVVPSTTNTNTNAAAHPNINTTTSPPMSSSVPGSHPPHPSSIGSNIPMLHPQSIPPHPGVHPQYIDAWPMQGPHPYMTQFPPETPGHPIPFHQGGFPTTPFPPHPIARQQNGRVPTVATIQTVPVVAGVPTVPGAPHQFGYAMPPPPPGTHPTHFHQPYIETIMPICGPYLTEKQRIRLAMSFPMLSEENFNLIKAAQQSVKDIWSLLPKSIRTSLIQETPELNISANNSDRRGKSFKKRKDYNGNSNNNSNTPSNNNGKSGPKKRAI